MSVINHKAPMSGLAKLMAMKGRGGDTMLAHINPMEAKMLKAMGGKGTPNPTTGLPEYDDNDESYGGESLGSGGSESSGQDEGGYGDLGSGYDTPAGENEGNVGGGNTEINDYLGIGRPMGSSDQNKSGRTTDQIVFDDNYNNPNGSFGNLYHEQLNPQGTEGRGYGGGFDMGGLGTVLANIAQRGTALIPGPGTLASIAIGKMRGQNTQDAIGRSLPLGMGTAYELTEEGKTPAERDASTEHSFSNIGSNILGAIDTAKTTIEGLWSNEVGVASDELESKALATNTPEAPLGDGSAFLGGTAFTDQQMQDSFGGGGEDIPEPRRPRRQMLGTAVAEAPEVVEEAKLRRMLNPDRKTDAASLQKYATEGGPSYYIMANTGGGLSDIYEMRGGGEFSGMVKAPNGEDGMSDDVPFDIIDDGEKGPTKALLSKDEYVIDAHSMSLLGNGSSDSGADKMDKFIKDLRKSGFGTTKQPKQLDGDKELSKLF